MKNDGRKLSLVTWGTVLTTLQAVYTKLMNTWNTLPAAYHEKVTMTITAELRKHLIDTKPGHATLPVLDDTSPEKIDSEMLSALIAEPLPVVPPYQQMQIPLAISEESIDAEDGIIPGDATSEEDTGRVSPNGFDSDEIREGTEPEDVGEEEESGDEGEDKSGDERDIS